MKKMFIIHVIAILLSMAGFIWSIAETLMYFIKDNPFNYGCFILFGVGVIVAFLNFLITFCKNE